jgi:hypothetical protein
MYLYVHGPFVGCCVAIVTGIEIEIEIIHNKTIKLDRLLPIGPLNLAIQDLLASWARVSSTRCTYRHT